LNFDILIHKPIDYWYSTNQLPIFKKVLPIPVPIPI